MAFLIVLIIVTNIVALIVPKQRTKIELFTVGMFAILLATLTDIFLDLKYHLYWYFTPNIAWRWLIPLLAFKAQMAILFINYFPVSSRFLKKIIYIFWWSVLSVVFEWSTVYIAGILHYNGWTIWYSVLIYPIILIVIALFFFYVRYLIRNNEWF